MGERLILDTGVLIDVERRVAELPPTDDDLAIAAISVSELLVGIERADELHRARRRDSALALLGELTILPFGRDDAEIHARLMAGVMRAGAKRGAHDLIIAATAARTARTVVTTDLRAFADLPGVAWRAL